MGKRVLKTRTFDSVKYATEHGVREAIVQSLKCINRLTFQDATKATMQTVIDFSSTKSGFFRKDVCRDERRCMEQLHLCLGRLQ